MPDIGDLRAYIARAEKRANAKLSRLERQGVDAQAFTPVRDPGRTRRYNSRQLERYADQLKSFNSERAVFVPDASGRALNPATWSRYQQAEQKLNQAKQDFYARFQDMQLPNGMTVAERAALRKVEHPHLANPAVNNPSGNTARRPEQMVNDRAAATLAADMERKARSSYFERQAKRGRDEFAQMAARINAPGLVDRVNRMSPVQWAALWTATNFAESMSNWYEISKLLTTPEDDAYESERSDLEYDAAEWLDWAETIE